MSVINLPFTFNEADEATWRQVVSTSARIFIQQDYSRDTYLIATEHLDERIKRFAIERYDKYVFEKEQNKLRSAGLIPQGKRKEPKYREDKTTYTRIGTLSLDYVFANMGKTIIFEGKEITIKSKRYACYARNGVTCVRCGIVGAFFAIEKHNGQETEKFHLNLYGLTNSNKEVLMTVDHVIPRSRGGEDKVSNLQPMCTFCNCLKGNRLEGETNVEAKEVNLIIEEMKKKDLIGKKVQKLSGKPFKSGFKVNTIKAFVVNPNTYLPAYLFEEDDSTVDMRTCEIIEDLEKVVEQLEKQTDELDKEIKAYSCGGAGICEICI